EALALRGTAELGELRAEATGTVDLAARRGGATVTLRHPGAPRLLGEAFGVEVGPWLGEGSFSLIAQLSAGPQGVAAESFELVAAGLRMGGALALATEARPRVTGRIAAEHLPVPLPGLRSAEPLGLEALAGFDAEVTLEAARIELDDAVLEAASAGLRLADGRLAVERLRGRIAGGALEGTLGVEVTGGPPRVTAELRIAGATVAAPV
uniref:AsmA family protein n=1 Tax=Falsiroseomonas oryziterrae TaxID=2911368 RepID=UPI001F47880B